MNENQKNVEDAAKKADVRGVRWLALALILLIGSTIIEPSWVWPAAAVAIWFTGFSGGGNIATAQLGRRHAAEMLNLQESLESLKLLVEERFSRAVALSRREFESSDPIDAPDHDAVDPLGRND